jgi:hypothetical protein
MSPRRTDRERGQVNVAFVAIAVILLPFLYSTGVHLLGPEEQVIEEFLEPAAGGDTDRMREERTCVDGRPAAFMRYHHWEFLKDLRDDVLRDGNRGGIRLQDCRQCHESRAAFCDRCHEAVNLTPDCWNCHSYP